VSRRSSPLHAKWELLAFQTSQTMTEITQLNLLKDQFAKIESANLWFRKPPKFLETPTLPQHHHTTCQTSNNEQNKANKAANCKKT